MHIAHKTAYLLLACAAVGIYWMTLPADRVEFDSACKPADAVARISALLHPQAFWQAQIDAAHALELWEVREPAAIAHDADVERQDATGEEARMESLSQSASALPSDPAIRQQTEIDEQNQRMNLIASLGKCEDEFRQRLGLPSADASSR